MPLTEKAKVRDHGQLRRKGRSKKNNEEERREEEERGIRKAMKNEEGRNKNEYA